MKIKLKSDFIDIYDHHFCGSWEKEDAVLERFSNSGMNRKDMLIFLGRFFDVPNDNMNYPLILKDNDEVVVHLDINSHRGENKIKVSTGEYKKHYEAKGFFATKYIEPEEQGSSYRYLKIGKKLFVLKYKSENDWRSNCGDVSIIIMKKDCNRDRVNYSAINKSIEEPIFAIDFVKSKDKEMIAIDFNISPGLNHIDGLLELITKREIYQEIENWFANTLS